MKQIAKWETLELSFSGRTDGNPFVDHDITARFRSESGSETKVNGFYDGDGTYRVRFLPTEEGRLSWQVSGNFSREIAAGECLVTVAKPGSHGRVVPRGTRFYYEDGTPYVSIGTTAYVWELQSEKLFRDTIGSLERSPFNKIRFCVLPKHYLYNLHEPATYPYDGTPCVMEGFDPESLSGGINVLPGNNWDFARFNPAHFRQIERAIAELHRIGVEADLILLHPYDRWGFSMMPREARELYIRYCVRRFSAYVNVWWAFANEYDLIRSMQVADWERMAEIVMEEDAFSHPRSIHSCMTFYDHTRPWITHASIQRQDVYKCAELTDAYRAQYNKPIVLDEIAYEGDIDQGWGNISGMELTRRFWECALRGGYPGHSEAFDLPVDPAEGHQVLWWSHGGILRGESPQRFAFLKRILEEAPGQAFERIDYSWDTVAAKPVDAADGSYILIYFGFNRPRFRWFHMDDARDYRAEVIDTWNMTVTDAGIHRGRFRVELPGREYMAVRLIRV